MQIGDSFSVPVIADRDDPKTVQGRVATSAWQFCRRREPTWQFCTHQMIDETGDSFIRCWRDK